MEKIKVYSSSSSNGSSYPKGSSKNPYTEKEYNDIHAVEENNYVPQKGDIIVINKIEGHPNGHIAMYSGKKWISDFVQIDMWGGSAFRNNKAAHVFFRK